MMNDNDELGMVTTPLALHLEGAIHSGITSLAFAHIIHASSSSQASSGAVLLSSPITESQWVRAAQ
jgi:hypothetical protein